MHVLLCFPGKLRLVSGGVIGQKHSTSGIPSITAYANFPIQVGSLLAVLAQGLSEHIAVGFSVALCGLQAERCGGTRSPMACIAGESVVARLIAWRLKSLQPKARCVPGDIVCACLCKNIHTCAVVFQKPKGIYMYMCMYLACVCMYKYMYIHTCSYVRLL